MSNRYPLSSTYLTLWCSTWDNSFCDDKAVGLRDQLWLGIAEYLWDRQAKTDTGYKPRGLSFPSAELMITSDNVDGISTNICKRYARPISELMA
jgi:hypothetical protein